MQTGANSELRVRVERRGDKYTWELRRDGHFQPVKFSAPVHLSEKAARASGNKVRTRYLARLAARRPKVTRPDIPRYERNPMSFKFFVGQAVEYTPIGEKTAALYRIVRQMPKEDQATDLTYRIKSETEAYERNVLECQLSSDVRPECEYAATEPRLPRGSHRT
jgi:hypothetical protein